MANVLPVRELFSFEAKELLTGLKTDLTILFEDEVKLELPYKEIIVFRYIMEIYRHVPNIKITSKHVLSNFYSEAQFTGSTIIKCCEAILKDVIELYVKPNNNNRKLLEPIYEEMYLVLNRIYNEIVYEKLSYASSVSIKDLLDVQMQPELIESMKQVAIKRDTASVNKTYEILDKHLRHNPDLKHNPVSKGYIAGTLNPNQLKQLLASRGYVTEIDSNIFKYPIPYSFTLGMQDIYSLAIESRSAAKALHMSCIAVQNSEYFARELQLVTMTVEKLVDGDCGSKDYMNWYVRPAEDGNKPDLPNLLGKRYFNEETGKEEIITSKHKHLEGKTIKLRVAMNCKHRDKRCVCSACFGELSYGVPTHSNLGHFCATELSEKLTQSLLSTKHLTSSATSAAATLNEISKNFLNIKGGNVYYLKNKINQSSKRYEIILEQKDARGLKDLTKGINIYTLDPSRVSRIKEFILREIDKSGKYEDFFINIEEQRKLGMFTYEFIDYVLNTGYKLDAEDRYVIDITDFDTKLPFIKMPELEYNFLNLSNNIKTEFKNLIVEAGESSLETPESLLQRVFDIVNLKLDVNIALLEVIIYAFTVMSLRNSNYDLGRNSDDRQLTKIKGIITNRSLGAGYAWEYVIRTILSPRSYNGNNAIDHPLDVMLKPNEVLANKIPPA